MDVFGIPLELILFLNSYLVFVFLGVVGILVRVQYPKLLIEYVLSLFVASSLSEGIKYAINTSRPEPLLPGLTFEGGGFPSTHATVAFTALFFYVFVCTKRAGGKQTTRTPNNLNKLMIDITLAGGAVSVGVLRMISHAHFLSDILAGVVIGFVLTLASAHYDIVVKKRS